MLLQAHVDPCHRTWAQKEGEGIGSTSTVNPTRSLDPICPPLTSPMFPPSPIPFHLPHHLYLALVTSRLDYCNPFCLGLPLRLSGNCSACLCGPRFRQFDFVPTVGPVTTLAAGLVPGAIQRAGFDQNLYSLGLVYLRNCLLPYKPTHPLSHC